MSANPILLSYNFPYQSFLDDTQLHHALAMQRQVEPIVSSSMQKAPGVRGKLVALLPQSETPVTVRLLGAGKGSSTDTITLVPGQHARVKSGGFEGLEWGLPFGWLGGGNAVLMIADSDDALFGGSIGAAEVVIHRARYPIVTDANPSTTPTLNDANWPLRFPWKNAARYNTATPSEPIAQGGAPILVPIPTRNIYRLRVASEGSTVTTRFIWQGTSLFDTAVGGDNDNPTFTDFSNRDISWPIASGTSTPFPVIEVLDPDIYLGGDAAVVTIVDVGGVLAGASDFIDVVRMGRLG